MLVISHKTHQGASRGGRPGAMRLWGLGPDRETATKQPGAEPGGCGDRRIQAELRVAQGHPPLEMSHTLNEKPAGG